jgi:hypothetical protein
MTDQPAGTVLGTFESYSDLHHIMRARAADLRISRTEVDRLARLTPGHVSKLLAPRPIRKAGESTLPFLLSALGIRLIALTDPQSEERINATAAPRDESRVHSDVVTLQFSRRHFQRMGRIGGAASRKYLSPEERTRLARKAGFSSAEARRKRR